MKAFIWTFFVMGLLEVGMSIAYLISGAFPERTRGGMAINLICWACFAVWAASLLVKGTP